MLSMCFCVLLMSQLFVCFLYLQQTSAKKTNAPCVTRTRVRRNLRCCVLIVSFNNFSKNICRKVCLPKTRKPGVKENFRQ